MDTAQDSNNLSHGQKAMFILTGSSIVILTVVVLSLLVTALLVSKWGLPGR